MAPICVTNPTTALSEAMEKAGIQIHFVQGNTPYFAGKMSCVLLCGYISGA